MNRTTESDAPLLERLGEDDSAAVEEYQKLLDLYDHSMRNLTEGEIVTGRVIGITSDSVIVDIGYVSEGLIPIEEFTGRHGKLSVEIGEEVDVLLEKTEDLEGHVLLSFTKAQRMHKWTEIELHYKEGKILRGRVLERTKGGLIVDVGLRAFLPGSLVDIKPVKNLESLRGQEMDFKVISLDRRRNNIVLSRKAVLEKELEKKKAETLKRLEEGARLKGVAKNITDYGVFIDLGGIDGLLHITDISWGRVNHPSEHFSVGDEIEVVVLKFDPETERVSLGYKQKSDAPWTLVDKKYPIGSRVKGRVVSLVDYGAFVEIEEGVEGLIHVSEMSWTKKIVNPAKILEVGDEVEAIVSELDMDQRRISLSLRQTERNTLEIIGAHLTPAVSKNTLNAPFLRTTLLDRQVFVREMISRLGDRAWMADEFVTKPFLLEVELSSTLWSEAEYNSNSLNEIQFDITPFLEEGTDPQRLVFLAFYPSGAVRGLTATVTGDEAPWVSIQDTSAVLDPDVNSDRPPSHCEVRLVALEIPSL